MKVQQLHAAVTPVSRTHISFARFRLGKAVLHGVCTAVPQAVEATGRVRDGSGGSSHGAADPDSDVEEYDAGDDGDDGAGRRNGAGRAAALAGGPPQLVSLDLWMLLLLLGGRKAKEADRVLRAKLSEGARVALARRVGVCSCSGLALSAALLWA